MTRERRCVRRAARLILLSVVVGLILTSDAVARATERADPPYAWWKAADMGRYLSLETIAEIPAGEEPLDITQLPPKAA